MRGCAPRWRASRKIDRLMAPDIALATALVEGRHDLTADQCSIWAVLRLSARMSSVTTAFSSEKRGVVFTV